MGGRFCFCNTAHVLFHLRAETLGKWLPFELLHYWLASVGHLAEQLKHFMGHTHPILNVQKFKAPSAWDSNCLLMHTWGGGRGWVKHLNVYCSHGRSDWSFRLRILRSLEERASGWNVCVCHLSLCHSSYSRNLNIR